MSEEREIKDAERMVRVEENIDHLTKSFDEFKKETKEYHDYQTIALDGLNKEWGRLSGLLTGQSDLQSQINDLDKKIEENYVSKEELDPIKKLVYGFVTVILLAVIGAIVSLVLIR